MVRFELLFRLRSLRYRVPLHFSSRSPGHASVTGRDRRNAALADSYVKRLFSSLKISDDSQPPECCEHAGHITPSWARTGSALETIGSPS